MLIVLETCDKQTEKLVALQFYDLPPWNYKEIWFIYLLENPDICEWETTYCLNDAGFYILQDILLTS